MFLTYFKDLFKFYPTQFLPNLITCATLPDNILPCSPPSILEIKDALWDLKPNKAPGYDGFQPGYYQKCWDSVHHLLCADIQNCFEHDSIPRSWNKSLICLIPKSNNPSEISHYRAKSLCSTLYKIVAKILVKRLKNSLPNLISFNQGAFVLGRKPSDNIVIAQEVVHLISSKKGNNNGWMVIKLDLEKAYDKISWDFICNTLKLFNFPLKWVQLIYQCISSVQHSIIFNGSITEFFIPNRGIRQGDPLSPYLFIICMELLSSLIEIEVHNKRWNAPKFKDIAISHLLYANDVLLFAKVNKKSVKSIDGVLKKFLNASGLNINTSKSSIWFSPNTNPDLRAYVSSTLGFKEASSPGKYLDIPLGIKGKKKDFDCVVDKIKERFETWNNKYLSPMGKMTLINSVLLRSRLISCRLCPSLKPCALI